MSRSAVAIALLLVAAPARAEDPDLAGMPRPPAPAATLTAPAGAAATVRASGRWWNEAQTDLVHDGRGEDVYELHSRFDLSLGARVAPGLELVAGGRLRWDARGTRERYALDAEAREIYVAWQRGALSARVGQHVVRWGSTDATSPNDVVSPVDYRDGVVPGFETPLVPLPALQVQASFPHVALEAVVVPVFVANRFAVFGTDWGFAGDQPQLQPTLELLRGLASESAEEDLQPLLAGTHAPDETPTNASGGGRLTLRGAGFDLHASAFYGWDRTPIVEVAPLAARYGRQLSAGLDGSVAIGEVVAKVDVAVSPERTLYTTDLGVLRPPVLAWAAGLDWTPSSRWFFLAEASGLSVLELAPEDRQWLYLDRDTVQLSAYARASYLDGDLDLELTFRVGSRGDWFVLPSLAARPWSGHRVALGALFIDGPPGSLGGLYQGNDLIFGQYTLFF